VFKAAGIPRPTAEDLREFGSSIKGHACHAGQFASFPAWAQEIIFFHTSLAISNDALKPGVEVCVDVSQNIDRACCREDVVPCLTGSSAIYLLSRQRLLLGQEALALQGMSRARFEGFKDKFLQHLAGDAFNGPCAMAALVAVLCQPQCLACPR